MIARRPSLNLLRSGVSLTALAAAWALPGAAQAQTCSMGATIDGVGPGTSVTCPAGTQLDFPGAVVVGPFTIPNGSTLTGLATGTNPTHQGWSYTDPNGNAVTVFIQGIYNLRNGIGGTTELQGVNILGLSGAGACGAGAQICPNTPGGGSLAQVNVTGAGGGGAQSGFALPGYVAPAGPSSFAEALDYYGLDRREENTVAVYDENGEFAGFYQDITKAEYLEENEDATEEEADAFIAENERLGALRGNTRAEKFIADGICAFDCRAGIDPDDLTGQLQDVLDTVPPEVMDAYDACGASGASCTYVLLPEDGEPGTFHYGPVVNALDPSAPQTFDSSDTVTITGFAFDDYLYSDPSGVTVYFATTPDVNIGAIANLLEQHTANTQLLQSQQNGTGASGSGVQGSFSVPSLDGSFLFTSNGQNHVVGPVADVDSAIGGELRFVYNTAGIHPSDEHRPEGGSTAYAISLILNDQDSRTLKLPPSVLTPGLDTSRPGAIIGMGSITGVRGGQFTLQRPSAFIVLPPDAPPPNATNIGGYFPGEPKDVKPGAVLYDRRTGQRIGVVVDDFNHVVIDDNPAARAASTLPFEAFDDGS